MVQLECQLLYIYIQQFSYRW